MRDPIVHTKRSSLETVCRVIGLPKGTANTILVELHRRNLQLKNYYVLPKAQSKIRQKVQKELDAVTGNTDLFYSTLVYVRKSVEHKSVTPPILPGTKNYQLLVEVSNMAAKFAEDFGLSRGQGIKQYVEIGVGIMGKRYAINKFKTYNDKIYEYQTNSLVLDEDPSPDLTKKFLDEWVVALSKHTAVKNYSVSSVAEMVHYVWGKEAALISKATFEDWIEAQIEGLSFMGVIPEPYQLYGDNAKLRYDSYIKNKTISKDSLKNEGTKDSKSYDGYKKLVQDRANKA